MGLYISCAPPPPPQPAGVHIERALNVLVASEQTQHNEPPLPLHWQIGCDAGPIFKQTLLPCVVFGRRDILVASHAVNICITFIRYWINVEDVEPLLYKCYTNCLCLLGWTDSVCRPTLPCKVKIQHLLT